MLITLSGTMVISCLVNIVQGEGGGGGGGGMFHLVFGYSKNRQKRSSVSSVLQPIVDPQSSRGWRNIPVTVLLSITEMTSWNAQNCTVGQLGVARFSTCRYGAIPVINKEYRQQQTVRIGIGNCSQCGIVHYAHCASVLLLLTARSQSESKIYRLCCDIIIRILVHTLGPFIPIMPIAPVAPLSPWAKKCSSVLETDDHIVYRVTYDSMALGPSWHHGNTLFCCAVTSILSQRLLHKMTDSRAVYTAYVFTLVKRQNLAKKPNT